MEKVIMIAAITCVIFCFAKFAEMKFLEKEMKPMKYLIRDTVIVFSSTLMATFGVLYFNGSMMDFFNTITETKALNPTATQIFTGTPEF